MTAGFVIGSIRSGSGKTTVSLGLMRAFARRGINVAPFKCGPDYIDPAFHSAATGRASINLDSWSMPPELMAGLFGHLASGADLVIGEGLMGLFDGVSAAPGRSGSSVDVAAATGLPVVLVHDVSGQSASAAAVVLGVKLLDPRVRLAGVILNKVGSERHRRLVTEAIEAIGVPVLGALPRSDQVSLPERHLGLVQAEETAALEALLEAMADLVERHVSLDRVQEAASVVSNVTGAAGGPALPPPGQRIALARDVAFSFLYPHHTIGWRAAGAEIVPFSPLADEAPPDDCDVCWLPGGYPELHAGRLADNSSFLEGLRAFAKSSPVHGECGGFMVLGDGLIDAAGERHAMAGLLGVTTSFERRKLHLGYRTARLAGPAPFGAEGQVLSGHEFHYASIIGAVEDTPFAFVRDAHGSAEGPDGARRGLVTGSFFHAIARADG